MVGLVDQISILVACNDFETPNDRFGESFGNRVSRLDFGFGRYRECCAPLVVLSRPSVRRLTSLVSPSCPDQGQYRLIQYRELSWFE